MFKRNFFCPLLCGSTYNNLKEHLIFCTNKNLLGKYYFQCPYNSNHIIGKRIYDLHIQHCPELKKKKNEGEKHINLSKLSLNNKNNNQMNKSLSNYDLLNDLDEFKINSKFSKVKESKKEIELKEYEKKVKTQKLKNKKEEKKLENLNNIFFYEKISSMKNIFILDNLYKKKNNKDEIYSVSTNKTDASDYSEDSFKKMNKSNKKKVTFGRMIKVIVFKKKEDNIKLNKNQKISTDGQYLTETYMKFL